MSIKLELYRVFKEVADNGSVSAAAKNLYISQSAVSQAIKQLEDQLEVKLFTRGTRGVTLTGEGNTLYQYVSSAIGLIQSAEEKISLTKSLDMGQLIIGASDTITLCFLLNYLDEFHRLYPNIRLHVLNGTSLEVIDLLRSGKVDVAFANLPVNDRGLDMHHCFDIHDVFVASSDYDCDFEQCYTWGQVAKMPMIMMEKKSNSRLYIDRLFLEQGIVVTPEIELGSHDLVLALTKIGLGISCVIREFSQEAIGSGDIKEILVEPPLPSRSIGAFSLKNVSLEAVASRFLEMIGCRQCESEVK